MARVAGGQVELRTRSGLICTAWFPEIAQPLANVAGGPHVIDGEACVLDELSRSRCRPRSPITQTLAVHDLGLAAALCKPARPLETRANSHALHGSA
jgi:ATP-dependent DNA ligase